LAVLRPASRRSRLTSDHAGVARRAASQAVSHAPKGGPLRLV